MKKILLYPSLIFLIIGCIICLNSCGDQLARPSGFMLDNDTQTLSWERVSGAVAYSITIGDKAKTTKLNSYSLENLEPGEYDIQIVALGDGETIKDSPPATYSYKRDQESGLLYKLINNNTEYELVGIGGATGEVVMESEFRGKPVTSMAVSAIAHNGSITSFTISPTIKEIPKKAFYNCNAMVSVVIPDSVEVIGENAFQSCKSLVSVTIPEKVKVISDSAFSYCRALETAVIGSNVEVIGNSAFSDCSALTAINLPDGVTSIGEYAFSGCESVQTITMGSKVDTIGDYAFYSCNLVEKIDLSVALTHIGESAFEYCSGLKKIEVPSKVTFIGSRSFAFCDNLGEITIGNNVQTIGEKAFLDTKYYKEAPEIVYVGNWIISCKNPSIQENKDLTPLIKEGTVGVADGAFRQCKGFTGVELPDIKHIGKSAFFECTNLIEVVCGPNAETIGKYAFTACSKLKTVLIKDTKIKYIGTQAFYRCEKLKNVDLPASLEEIGTYAFKDTGIQPSVDGVLYLGNWVVGCASDGISNIRIREGITNIANYSFFKCAGIENVSLPDSLETIGRGAFMMCSKIYIEEFPENLKTIEDYAFYACDQAVFGKDYDMILPEGLEYIGRSAFYQSNVLSITIPGSCKYIGDYAFFGCRNLGINLVLNLGDSVQSSQFELVLKEGIEHIGDRAFFGCDGLTTVTIPNSVAEIGIRAFYGCSSLKSVKIGRGLKDIPDYAFYGCTDLMSVELGRGVETIGKWAFGGCETLHQIDLGNSLVRIGKYAFSDCKSLEGLVLPDSLMVIEDFALRDNMFATSIIIPDGVSELGQHVYYADNYATIYCENTSAPIYWHKTWNSSFRPVIWGCVLSDDNSYVVSFVKTESSIENFDAVNGISAPIRKGYTFMGWATEANGSAVYSASEVTEVPNGTILYAVWDANGNIE